MSQLLSSPKWCGFRGGVKTNHFSESILETLRCCVVVLSTMNRYRTSKVSIG